MPNVITEKKLQLSAFIDYVLDLGWNCMIQNAVSGYWSVGMVLRIVEVQMGQVVWDRNVDKGYRAVASEDRTTKEKRRNQRYQYFPRPQSISTKCSMWASSMIAGAELWVLFHDFHYWKELYCLLYAF